MRMKGLFVTMLLLMGCVGASAQSFGFLSPGGGLYCNYLQLAYAGNGAWGGLDNFSVCGQSVNSTISGFSATLAGDGQAGHGAGVIYGDSVYAVLSGDPYAQWTAWTSLKCNKIKNGKITGKVSFVGVAALSGHFLGGNYGYLSCSIPGKDGVAPTRGSTVVSKNR
ncbi:MAG: hypothetical protein ABSG70_00830 [Terriglobales bacterium]|jgi:hypothetical protein